MSMQLILLNSFANDVGIVLNRFSIIITFVIISMFFFNVGYSVNDEGRFTLGGDNENQYAIKLCVLTVINLFNSKLGILLKLASSVFLIYLIFLSGSKTALFLVFFIILYYLWVTKNLYYFAPLIIIFIYTTDFLNFFESQQVFSRYSSFFEKSIQEDDRKYLIDFFLDSFLADHNIIIGLGDYKFSELGKLKFNAEFTPHNFFLELYLRYGLLGFLAFIFPLGLLFFRARLTNLTLCLFFCLFFTIFFGQFLNSKLAWFLVFVTYTVSYQAKIVKNSNNVSI
jgi:hypothetical protein